MKLDDKKPLLIILGSALLLMLIIIIPLIITGEKFSDDAKKDFPTFDNVKVNKKTFSDNESYEKLKDKLVGDYLFEKIVSINDYDSNSVLRKDLSNLVENYMVNYELSNTKYLAIVNKEKQFVCMTEKNLVTSFNELYNMDITPYLKTLSYYHKYFFKKTNYCMYYNLALNYNARSRKIYINKLEYNDDNNIITADVYIYSYVSTGEYETDNQKALRIAFENKNFSRTKELIKDEIEGKCERKTVKFKINNDGKFFKYQIISIKTLDN